MANVLKGLCALALGAAVSGCTEIPSDAQAALGSDTPGAARALRACPRAIARQTGASGITLNTEIVIVEINQYIFDVPGQERPWTCITDDAGAPKFLYPTRVISG